MGRSIKGGGRRGFKIVAGSTAIALLVSIVALKLQSPTYESRALFKIGNDTRGKLLEDPRDVIAALRNTPAFDANGAHPSDGGKSFSLQVETERNHSENFVSIRSRASSSEVAVGTLRQITTSLLEAHAVRYTALVQREEELSALTKKIVEQEAFAVQAMSASIRELERSRADRMKLAELRFERDKVRLNLLKDEKSLLEDRFAKGATSAEPSILVLEPTVPSRPIWPIPAVYTGVALLVGVAAGLVAITIIQAVDRARG